MMALGFIGVIWLAVGLWLTIGGLRKALPAIQAEDHPLPLKVFGFAFALVVGTVWLPARYAIALVRIATRK